VKKTRPPCIRNIDKFKKTGCPQKSWDGEEGCTAWIELAFANRDNPEKRELKKQCIDVWMFEFQWATLGETERVGQAVEGNRNMTAYLAAGISGVMPQQQIGAIVKRQLKLQGNS